MSFSDLLHNFETFHDNHAGVKQENAKLYRLVQSTVIDTQTWGTFLSCFLCFFYRNWLKNPTENINSCVICQHWWNYYNYFLHHPFFHMVFGGLRFKSQLKETNKWEKKYCFVTHYMFIISTLKLFQVMTQSYTDEAPPDWSEQNKDGQQQDPSRENLFISLSSDGGNWSWCGLTWTLGHVLETQLLTNMAT